MQPFPHSATPSCPAEHASPLTLYNTQPGHSRHTAFAANSSSAKQCTNLVSGNWCTKRRSAFTLEAVTLEAVTLEAVTLEAVTLETVTLETVTLETVT